MATVYVTFRIMPESPEVSLSDVEASAKKLIESNHGTVGKVEQKPIAFGLKALDVIFSISEEHGGTDELEEKLTELEGVQSVQVTDVRRAIG